MRSQFKERLEYFIENLLSFMSFLTVVLGLVAFGGAAFMFYNVIATSFENYVAPVDLVVTAFLVAVAMIAGLGWLVCSRLDLRKCRDYADRLNLSRHKFEQRLRRAEMPLLIALLKGKNKLVLEEQVWTGKPKVGSALVSNAISALLQQTDQRAQALGNTVTAQSCFSMVYSNERHEAVRMDDGEKVTVITRTVTIAWQLPPEGLTLYFPTLFEAVQVGGER